jgi:hypothetical protein
MTTREDLDLLAQSYVLGELDNDETARFERMLADDQGAREAVTRAVGLADALADGRPATTVRPRRWPYVAAAAALLLAAAGVVITLGSRRTSSEATELIECWIAFDRGDQELRELEDPLEEETLDDALTPGWLVTALEERDR